MRRRKEGPIEARARQGRTTKFFGRAENQLAPDWLIRLTSIRLTLRCGRLFPKCWSDECGKGRSTTSVKNSERPKPEIRKKSEIRSPKIPRTMERATPVRPAARSLRASGFGFLSAFGLRLAGFRQTSEAFPTRLNGAHLDTTTCGVAIASPFSRRGRRGAGERRATT